MRSRVIALVLIIVSAAALSAQQRKSWPAPETPARVVAASETSLPAPTAFNPGIVSMAGDDDGFGYGVGHVFSTSCETFDNREPEDLGVFDQRQPGSTYNSICDFAGGWTHSFAIPPGGAGQVTLQLRILGGQGSTAFCFAAPCGCETPAQKIYINGVEEPFFGDPGCATTTSWTKSWQGAAAASIAAPGTLGVQVDWGKNAFAIDYSRLTILPAVEVIVEDGNGQKGAISNAVEKKLKVKFTTMDPSFNLEGMQAVFEFVSVPANASGHGLGANEASATSQTYSVAADANGIATATLLLGDKQGSYVVQVKSPLSLTGAPAVFTATAKKPASVVMLKDTTDIAEATPTYAVSSESPTQFLVIGLDTDGSSLGPVKCNWSTAAGGNPATRGGGTVAPAGPSSTTTFTPAAVGHLTIKGNPPIAGVATASANVFITALYVDVDGTFTMNAPIDQGAQFVPGALLDGSSVNATVMASGGQAITLHVLTGPGSKGMVTFTLPDAEVSKWPGIATNFPVGSTDTNPDLVFGGGASTVAVPFAASGDTTTTLYVRDYAAIGTINVSIKSGKPTYSMPSRRLPKDADGNKISDAGWRAESAQISDLPLQPGKDEDDNPQMKLQLPPGSGGFVGDNLTNYEEYRGFVLNGQHRRTNPFHKNYFVEASDFSNDIRYAFPSLPTGTYLTTTTDATASLIINNNDAGLPGATMAAPDGHIDQKIHRVRRSDLPSSTVTGQTVCEFLKYVDSPCVPNNATNSTISMYVINNSAAAAGVTDPNVIAEYRRSTVAHECGHSLNLFHNLSTTCLMYGSGSWTNIVTTFCGPVDTTIVDCVPCLSLNSDLELPVTNFSETDTLRIKEDQRP